MNHSFGMLGLYVRDVEKATAFYTEFLGIKYYRPFRVQPLPSYQPKARFKCT